MKKFFVLTLSVSIFLACKKESPIKENTPLTNNGGINKDSTKINNEVSSISGFDCAGVQIVGKLEKDKVASNVIATIKYSGGNGKNYNSQTLISTGVTGLTATLSIGTLLNGNGSLIYSISGTPSSEGTASFAVDFGGKSCSIIVKVEDVVQNPISGYGPKITDIDGNFYKTVYIGKQQWMAENLKVSKYNDGTTIPNITDDNQWQNNKSGAWSYYNNDLTNNVKYGKLYNWYAMSQTANGNKNLCPVGWHVSTDIDWEVLLKYIGEENTGGKMKETGTSNWSAPNTDATNTSLFTGLPGGSRDNNGSFYEIGGSGYWWKTILDSPSTTVWFNFLESQNGYIHGDFHYYRNIGFSIRCVKD